MGNRPDYIHHKTSQEEENKIIENRQASCYEAKRLMYDFDLKHSTGTYPPDN